MPAVTFDEAPVRTAIKTMIAGVAGIGQMHEYERFANKPSALIAQYKSASQTGDRLDGGFVSKIAWREIFIATSRWVRDIDWRIGYYLSLDDADATEKKLGVLVESIADAFRNSEDLGLGAGNSTLIDPGVRAGVQLQSLGPVMFAGVLCHRALMLLTTRHYLG